MSRKVTVSAAAATAVNPSQQTVSQKIKDAIRRRELVGAVREVASGRGCWRGTIV